MPRNTPLRQPAPATGHLPVPRYPVVVFDLDGTLLQGTTISLFLADSLGHREIVEELERRCHLYDISIRDASLREAALFQGSTVADIRGILKLVPWITGLDETLSALAAAGCHLLLATLAWRFASDLLQERHPFAAVSGSELAADHGTLTGKVSRYFDEADKLVFVEQWCAIHGYQLGDVAAVGDSRSDVQLFNKVPFAIGLNATADARAVAHISIDTDDLRDILPLLLPAYQETG